MKLNISTPSTGPVVSLDEFKDHTRVDFEDDDAYLTSLLIAETDRAEKITNRAFMTQTIDLFVDEWAPTIELPRPPLQSVTSVTYRSKGSTAYSNTAASTLYLVNTHGFTPFIRLKESATWPSTTLARTNPIRVRYVAGYGAKGSDVPEGIRLAIQLNAADRYEHREESSETPLDPTGAAGHLLAPYRVRTF